MRFLPLYRFLVSFLFWSVLFVPCLIQAQELPLPLHHLNSERGLSQSTNSFIYRDTRGFVWVSSLDGLNCFNGHNVRVYRPDSHNPRAIKGRNIQSPFFEDANGDIWFTTERALNCYRSNLGDFDHYVLPKSPRVDENILHAAYYFEQKRWLWVSAGDSLFRFDTKHPQLKESVQSMHSFNAMRCGLGLTPEGRIRRIFACFWDLSPGFEVISYDLNGQIVARESFFNTVGNPKPFTLTCREVVMQNDSVAWIATDKGILYFPYNLPQNCQLYAPKGEKRNIRSIVRKDASALWVITNEGNIQSFDLQIRKFSNAIADQHWQSIHNADVMLLDKDSVLWFAINGEGVSFSKLARRKFIQPLLPYSKEKLGITNLFEDDKGVVFCSTQAEETYLIDGGMKFLKTVPFPSYSKFFKDGKSRVWNVSAKGLGILTAPNHQVKVVIPANGLAFYDLVENGKGALYLGCSGKTLEILTSPKFEVKTIWGLPEVASPFAYDRFGQLWVGTSENLSVWEITSNTSTVKKKLYPNTGFVNQIVEDKRTGLIWVGSASGLIKINPETLDATLIAEKDGLPNQYIYAIVPDKKGNLWLSSNQGIIKYMPYNAVGHQFKQYTTRNGLSSDEYCPGAALMSRTGQIWFGSTKGVDVFHPDSIHDIGTAPQLAIVGLKIHDHEWRDSSTCIEMANRIELAYNENTLRLELAAMEYTFPEMNKFRVRLLKNGNDTSWVDLGTQNFITYANLRPGNYKFEFTACNSEGIWQETPRQLEIIIHPHFTQTTWFPWLVGALSLIVIGFGTAFYYRYQLRLQQLALEKQQREAERKQLLLENELALQEERNRIADEMHDELGGGLSTIRLASQRAQKVQSPDELQGILKRVSQISIGLVNNMRGIIWAMDSQNDSLRSLLAYIRQYAGTFLDDNGIAATLSLPSDFPDHSLSSQYRHNVMLTVKECLNNILKHAEATAVELKVDLGNQLHINIRDNGKGFEPVEHAGMGKGLRTTVKRMESVGGSIQWHRNPEGGMTVTLLAPLP
jgi:signal transduction histidine kinase/ligand-binding sensor domain-containing protein